MTQSSRHSRFWYASFGGQVFGGFPITSSIDYFSSFHEIPLARESDDLTAFMMVLGLVRLTRMPQGWTNLVAVFQQIISKVHFRQISYEALLFLDDFALKGSKSRYDDELISPGIRRFVFEHAQVFQHFIEDAWRSGMMISGHKCCIGMSGIVIVGLVCDWDGRRSEKKKMQKSVEWPTPTSIRDTRAFIGLALYYCVIVLAFSIVATPIFALFERDAQFSWDAGKQTVMDELKRWLITALILIALDFTCSALEIYIWTHQGQSVGVGSCHNFRMMGPFILHDLKVGYGLKLKESMMRSSWNAEACLKLSRNFGSGFTLDSLQLKLMLIPPSGYSTNPQTAF